jgi:hypothetical protein
MSKVWYQSRTVWFNVLVALFELLSFFYGDQFRLSTEELTQLSTAVAVIGNIVLRFMTKSAVTGKMADRNE